MMRLRTSLALSGLLLVIGCATSGDKNGSSNSMASSPGKNKSDDLSDDVSRNRKTLTNSQSNNPFTSHTVNLAKANAQLSRLPNKSQDINNLEGRLYVQRLLDKNFTEVLETAKAVARLEMAKNPENTVNPGVKLELALSAIQKKKFALAEYFLKDVLASKNPKLRAGAYNAIGVVALNDGRIPEAVENFKRSLKESRDYEPAALNLGFIALRGGDLDTAKVGLGNMQDDWFVQYALISMGRLEGNTSRVENLCQRILRVRANHKPTLFNCALHAFQTQKKYLDAKSYLDKMQSTRGGASQWDKKANVLMAKVRVEAQKEAAQIEKIKRQKEKAKAAKKSSK